MGGSKKNPSKCRIAPSGREWAGSDLTPGRLRARGRVFFPDNLAPKQGVEEVRHRTQELLFTTPRNCYIPLAGTVIPLAGTVTTKDNLFIPVKIF